MTEDNGAGHYPHSEVALSTEPQIVAYVACPSMLSRNVCETRTAAPIKSRRCKLRGGRNCELGRHNL